MNDTPNNDIPIGTRVKINCSCEPEYNGCIGVLEKIVRDEGEQFRGIDIWHHHIRLDDGREFVGQRCEYYDLEAFPWLLSLAREYTALVDAQRSGNHNAGDNHIIGGERSQVHDELLRITGMTREDKLLNWYSWCKAQLEASNA